MRTILRSLLTAGLVSASYLGVGTSAGPADAFREPARTTDQLGLEVQARGPVHEAFAQLTPTNPEAGPIAPRQPPQPVREVPPEQKPDSDQVQWIPGYWSWDADKKDYLWVSGTWRAAPAERQWVPGHWAKTDDGWQWVPGFWAETQQRELDYLPQPPDSLDYGPSAPAPNDNSFYVPGCWLPLNGRYAWRPGFWSACRAGRIWMPSRYSWTPGGYVFLNGYWDYPLEDRGLLFAPVCFNRPLYDDPNWYYRPNYVVGIGSLFGCFFARPSYGCYYFGDYFGRGYGPLGFSPWLTYGPRFHDPLYRYYSWSHRGDPGWQRNLQATYRGRNGGQLALPPRTLAAQNALLRSNTLPRTADRSSLQMVRPLSDVRGAKLAAVSATQRSAQQSRSQNYRSLSSARGRIETPNRSSIRGPAPNSARTIRSLPLANSAPRGARVTYYPRATGSPATIRYSYPRGSSRAPVIRYSGGNRAMSTAPSLPSATYRPAPAYRSSRSYRPAASSYRSSPSYRPAPSYRSSPSYRGGSSNHGGGGNRGGGSRGSAHGGGHKK